MSAKKDTFSILEKHKLRKTSVRADILKVFLIHSHALSHADIEESLGSGYDRVTIYRTLYSFEEKGLIHKVPDDGGIQKFALCHDHCDEHNHQDDHLHFLCTKCCRTFCLEGVELPDFVVPQGYSVSSVNFSVQGICRECN